MSRIKLDKQSIAMKPSAYMMSSGGQTTKARGFALLRLAKKYILILSTKNQQWKLEASDMPDGWFNLGFTWENDKLLKLFVDGKLVSSAKAIQMSRPEDSFSTLDIGRPNNSAMKKHRMSLSIDSIGLWEKALSDHQMKTIGQTGTSLNVFNRLPSS